MATIISSSNEIADGVANVMIDATDPVPWTNGTKRANDPPVP